ncbi:MAG: cation:proton antiporter [Candidatus Atribacteria bacterium]|jgi:multicomponent Na+:H+ antiporter subunit E|nr:cation:proton antiporter [Candidatus Atribacteria bacterium]
MIPFLATFFLTFLAYLFIAASSGEILALWSKCEVFTGIIVALIASALASRVLFQKKDYRLLNPVRWALFLYYLIAVFLPALVTANLDVAYRVITGKINPGIVKISPQLESDAAITLLANSITLTPGTLSVDIDGNNNDLYIHWINVTNLNPSVEDICGTFCAWARRIAE